MRIIRSPNAMQRLADQWRGAGARVGVVPTMGALHAGHDRLIRTARRECERVVVTLFVNPTQFAPHEDLQRYPRTLAADRRMARSLGADAMFEPEAEALYPAAYATTIQVAGPAHGWEGASRPAHFAGVATVVAKLFHLTRAHRAYFGQKDAQQAAVVRRMVADLHFDLIVRVCPTVRERDGLAVSSRNRYLSPEERAQATCLYEALRRAKALARDGERRAARLKQAMRRVVGRQPLPRLDYVGIVDRDTMRELTHVGPGGALAIVAAFLGRTRLLDNAMLKVAA